MTQNVVDQAKAVVEKIQDKGRQSVALGKQKMTDAVVLTEKLLNQAKHIETVSSLIYKGF